MDFFCSFFQPNDYHAEVYSVPAKNTSNLTDTSAGMDPRNPNQLSSAYPQEHALSLAYSVPLQRIDSATTIEGPMVGRLRSSPNPERPNSKHYDLIDAYPIPKGGLVNLLRDKDKTKPSSDKAVQTSILRMIKKSDYQQKANSNNKGKKWQDQSFPPAPAYNTKNQRNQVIQLVWPSLQELCILMERDCCFMDDDLNPTDIVQGNVGDCYFLSAVAALIRKTDRIPRLFPNCKLNKNGVYMAQLMSKGMIQEVVVDERFPVDKAKKSLLGCTSSRKKFEIYGMVLEKCWAKLWKSYQEIDGGLPNQALHALTGAPTKNYILENETTTAQFKQSFFQQALGFSYKDFVMCAGTYTQERMMYASDGRTITLPKSHVFCVEYFYEHSNNQRMVRLYNPWGFNWTNDPNISGQVDATWDEFIAKFQYLSVCKVNDYANYISTQLQDCKKGVFKFIELNVDDPKDGYIAISLSQTDRKKPPKEKPYLMTTFFAVKCVSDAPNAKYQYASIRTNYEHPDHYFELNGVTSGKYLIAMYFSQVEVKEKLTFGVYSEAIFGLKEVDFDQKSQQYILQQAFRGYQLKKPTDSKREYLFGNDKDVWYSFNVMCNKSNFGYLMLHVGKNEKSCQIAMGKNAVTSTKLTMWKPYDAEKISLKGEPGTDKIVFMTVDKLLQYREMDSKFDAKKTRYHINNILISKS